VQLETRAETACLQSSKLKYHQLLSNFAFNFNLRPSGHPKTLNHKHETLISPLHGGGGAAHGVQRRGAGGAWGGVTRIENKHSTNVGSPPPPPRVCLSIQPEGTSCFDFGRVLVLFLADEHFVRGAVTGLFPAVACIMRSDMTFFPPSISHVVDAPHSSYVALVLSDWLQTCPIAHNFSDTLVTLAATCEVGRGGAS